MNKVSLNLAKWVSGLVAHIAHKKRNKTHKGTALSWATLSLVLALALATGFAMLAANSEEHMDAAVHNHMNNLTVCLDATAHQDHMDV